MNVRSGFAIAGAVLLVSLLLAAGKPAHATGDGGNDSSGTSLPVNTKKIAIDFWGYFLGSGNPFAAADAADEDETAPRREQEQNNRMWKVFQSLLVSNSLQSLHQPPDSDISEFDLLVRSIVNDTGRTERDRLESLLTF